MAHKYGGPWSEIKLDAVEYYLQCFSKALTSARMETWYIDAFAGSGDREAERAVGGIFESAPYEIVTETLDGSARRALKIDPPYKHFIFIEMDAERSSELLKIKDEFPEKDIQIRRGDANTEIQDIICRSPWTLKGESRHRGVVFLDPYSLQVDWQTLRAIAATQSLDVWYLFPIRDVTRQLSHKRSGVGPKEAKLDRVLGPEWRELYSLPPPAPMMQTDIFGVLQSDEEKEELRRVEKWQQIEAWFKKRLEGEFAYVSDPLPILVKQNRQAFSLFLAVGNPRKTAVDLAKHFASHVNRKFAPRPASRRRSGR
ncbi:three-Cys-motif partner protein TcmP [Rhizobium leguminosarum]|jgi:three-Cys-motif partner protein|uniref:three-Cys-motif partner protein TcmP n=1 Tax=Rhizobium leguminosarum TaxID=384 RepID=UPI0012F8DABF|nr:three-Cys-motif partner protein TcmP [Rhizobium leguminosarum]MBA8833155.1 three-Cys-motif partner protein [Rhizobium leguminosarum]